MSMLLAAIVRDIIYALFGQLDKLGVYMSQASGS